MRQCHKANIESPKIQMSAADVLVVDDDIAVCRIVQRMLSNEQCNVQISQSVADALGAIEQKAFDAYVVDFKLPDGSGLDVAERVRSKWGATPIILISGYDPAAVALRATLDRRFPSSAIRSFPKRRREFRWSSVSRKSGWVARIQGIIRFAKRHQRRALRFSRRSFTGSSFSRNR